MDRWRAQSHQSKYYEQSDTYCPVVSPIMAKFYPVSVKMSHPGLRQCIRSHSWRRFFNGSVLEHYKLLFHNGFYWMKWLWTMTYCCCWWILYLEICPYFHSHFCTPYNKGRQRRKNARRNCQTLYLKRKMCRVSRVSQSRLSDLICSPGNCPNVPQSDCPWIRVQVVLHEPIPSPKVLEYFSQ